MRRSELLIVDLCDEIDYWKSEADRWKKEYEDLREDHTLMNKQFIAESKDLTKEALLKIIET